MQITTSSGTSSIPVIIGEACFSTKNTNGALASTAFLTSYNLAVEAIMYEVKWNIIPVANSVTLRQALITQINTVLQISGGYGSSFSTSGCLGNVPSTVATYCN
ncbi:hypothetical protein SAMN06297358_2407 [Pedobacter xixiisoli]|uniref:Uncharacterized protein n=1 Tax=Pedobacter xixiisoli TaxID=1476464 RepID=A0A286A0I2_9SPHI|nr:hypothetical protein SAMN06297358_2407 [Pedobacter xixiisoli]